MGSGYNCAELDRFLGKKLRSYRVKMRWPLKHMASELNVSIQQVQRYEQGTNKISASLLYLLAKIFGITPDSFFDGYESAAQNLVGSDRVYQVLYHPNWHQDISRR